jgi:hypothetical protein
LLAVYKHFFLSNSTQGTSVALVTWLSQRGITHEINDKLVDGQYAPLPATETLGIVSLQYRYRVLTPIPHGALHDPNEPHGDQFPSTLKQ